jgi:hypothetical protein
MMAMHGNILVQNSQTLQWMLGMFRLLFLLMVLILLLLERHNIIAASVCDAFELPSGSLHEGRELFS